MYFVVITIIVFFVVVDLVFFKGFLRRVDIENLPEKPNLSFFFHLFCDPNNRLKNTLTKLYEIKNPKDFTKLMMKLDILERKVTYACFTWFLILYLLGIVMFFVITISSYRRIIKSLRKLREGFERIMNHDYGYQVSLGGDFKEFEETIIAFNKTSKGIKTLNEELLNILKEWGER